MKVLAMFTVLMAMAGSAAAEEPCKSPEHPTTSAFEKLKSLTGDWTMTGGDGGVASSWKVTAGGSAVVETLFPGTPHEMVNIFTLQGKDIHLTHYCAMGNQPEMKSDKTADDKKIAFQFAGGKGINPKKDTHMHNATLTFTSSESIQEDWGTFVGGKAADSKAFELKRVAPPVAK